MSRTLCFIERGDRESPSIERVFRSVAAEIEKHGWNVIFVKAPYGNRLSDTVRNLLAFRPPPADIYHITGHVHYLGLILPVNKTVLTIHDLTILNFRSGLRRWLIEKLYFVWPVRRLKFLTAISEATRENAVRTADIPRSKVKVIGNPLLVSISESTPFNKKSPTLLQIGGAPNKNVDRLVEALDGLNCRLHFVGKLPDRVRGRLEASSIEFSHDPSLDDSGIERAYENADIVSLCSTDEGFGLPIIEAQAKGKIVITSDRPPMSDVAGGAAVMVDPESVDSIRDGIQRILADAELRIRLRDAGTENIRRFDTAEIGSEYLKLYQAILSKSE